MPYPHSSAGELSQAMNFALDCQEESRTQGVNHVDALALVVPRYPSCVVGETITFPDGSEVILEMSAGRFAYRIEEHRDLKR